jgi:ZIP family zinc transporter
MVLISVLELVPEALASLGAGPALLTAAVGAAVVWAAHFLIPHRHLVVETSRLQGALTRSAHLVVLGLVLHDLPEGFAMANAYIASPRLGVLTALAIALHNLPEEFAMAVPAVALRSKRFLFGAALLSALAEPAGAIIGLAAVGIAPSLNAPFLALAAGAMCFVALHELVPMARRYGQLGYFGWGVFASAVAYLLLSQLTVGRITGALL